MDNISISFILPVLNEAENIEFVVSEIESILRDKHFSHEFIFVNDGSTDNTSAVLSRLNSQNPNIIEIKNPVKLGKSDSLMKGAALAKGDVFVFMDGDGQIRKEDVSRAVEKLLEFDADIVLGSKYHPQSMNPTGFTRKMFGQVYNWMTRTILHFNFTDIQSGLKAMKADSYRALMPISAKRFDFDLKFITKAVRYGMEIEEVPMEVKERHSGGSKVNKFVTSFSLLVQIFEIFVREHLDPKIIAGNYQYKALHQGGRMQRFWHANKITLIKNIVNFRNSDVVLDAGCGSGNLCFSLSEICKEVDGIDMFEDAVKFAEKIKKRKGFKNCAFSAASLDKIPYEDGYFDKVFMTDVIEHLHDPDEALEEIKRKMKKGGQLVIVTPNYSSYWENMEEFIDMLNIIPKLKDNQHINQYNTGNLKELLSKHGFTTEKTGTFYGLSPFLSILFGGWAQKRFLKEIAKPSDKRALLYSVAVKTV
ncbi:MAG: methyltransferase domain-containing protein [Elusimicrobiota bacterium]